MVDDMALPRVMTNELTHCGQTQSRRKSWDLMSPDPGRESGPFNSIKLGKFCLLSKRGYLISGAGKHCFAGR